MKSDTHILLPFFNRKMDVSSRGIRARDNGPVSPAIAGVISRYLAGCPDWNPPTPIKWVTFREFSGAGPLFSRFTANTAKTLEQTFGHDPDELKERGLALGAEELEIPGFTLSLEFTALPRVPVRLLFNEADGGMPPTASFLYPDTAIRYLDLRDLMTTCTWLTGMLIQ